MPQQDKPGYPGAERRGADRVTPDSRLVVSIDGGSVRIAELSCSGVTLHGPLITVGSRVVVDIHLGKYHLSAPVEILRTSDESRSHGRFAQLSDEDAQALQDYVDLLLGTTT